MDDDELNLPEGEGLDISDDGDIDLDEEEDPLRMDGFHEVDGLETETDF